MKNKSVFLILTSVSALALLLAACGPADTSGLGTRLPGRDEALPPAGSTTLPGEASALPTSVAQTPAGQAITEGQATTAPESTAVPEDTAMPEGSAQPVLTPGAGTAVPEGGTTGGEAQAITVPILLNAPVQDVNGEQVGLVSNIILDLQGGRIPYLIITPLGLNNVEAAAIPVPWNFIEVQGTAAEPVVSLTVSTEALSQAPTVDISQWPAQAGANWDLKSQNYWSTIPAAQ